MKKLLPYILILILIAGFFSPFMKAQAAEDPNQMGTCFISSSNPEAGPDNRKMTRGQCAGTGPAPSLNVFTPDNAPNASAGASAGTAITTAEAAGADPSNSPLNPSCALITGDFDECLTKLFFYLFYTIPAFILELSAQFFNILIPISISSAMYDKASFISKVWAIVRDISNIFFLFVLLYVAIELILGLTHDAQKSIRQVVIMAILINFSMFFTKVVIDSSNILAQVFYNKISIEAVTSTGNAEADKEKMPYIPVSNIAKTGVAEKDIAGGLASGFNPAKMLSPDFWKKVEKQSQLIPNKPSWTGFAAYTGGGAVIGNIIPVVGTPLGAGVGAVGYALKTIVGFYVPGKIPTPLRIGIILVSGAIMLFAAYSFFVAGFSFLSRLIELWILIMASPFAFMSSTVPMLESVSNIGWRDWTKKLISISFMAPAYMVLLYLIFLVIKADPFSVIADRTFTQQGTIEAIILIVIPALTILILLSKATKYAKTSSGAFSGALLKSTELAMGVAGGLAIGGVAAGLQGSLGHWGKNIYESKELANWETDKNSRAKRFFGSKIRTLAGGDTGKGGLAGASFDARAGVVGGVLKTLGGASGLNFGHDSNIFKKEAGGYVADLKRRDQKRKEREAGLAVKKGEAEMEELRKAQNDQQRLMTLKVLDDGEDGTGHEVTVEQLMHDLDARIKKQQETLEQATKKANISENEEDKKINIKTANKEREKLEKIQAEKTALKNGMKLTVDGKYTTTNGEMNGFTLKAAEAGEKKAAEEVAKAERELTAAEKRRDEVDTKLTTKIYEEANAQNEFNKQDKNLQDAKTNFAAGIINESTLKAQETATKKAKDSLDKLSNEVGSLRTSLDKEKKATDEAVDKRDKSLDKEVEAKNAGDRARNEAKKLGVNITERTKYQDDLKIKIKEENLATENLDRLEINLRQSRRDLATDPSNRTYQNAVTSQERLVEDAKIKLTQAKDARKKVKQELDHAIEEADKKLNKSINDLEGRIIPGIKHKIDAENKARSMRFADIIESAWAFPWNKQAREISANDIRMGVKAEKHESHGSHGHDVFGHFVTDLAASLLAESVLDDHGGKSDSHSSPAHH